MIRKTFYAFACLSLAAVLSLFMLLSTSNEDLFASSEDQLQVPYLSNTSIAVNDTFHVVTPPNATGSSSINSSTDKQLWYDITPETLLWHVPHYEDREFAYGGPSVILMIFHRYDMKKPSLSLLVDEKETIETCHWVPFGKIVMVKYEDNYLNYAVFKLKDSNSANIPKNVQLLKNGAPITGKLAVHYSNPEVKLQFAACLHKCLFNISEDMLLDIASWIEINRAIGVEHITIYNQYLPPLIANMLNEYVKEGFVELIDWNIYNPKKKIGNNGQIATINDCFYRYLRRAKYIVFIDIDELIIPHSTSTLAEMMNLIKNDSVTQYQFYNSFWHDIGKVLTSESGKYTFDIGSTRDRNSIPTHFKRSSRSKAYKKLGRYKNIVKTSGAIRIGIHHLYAMKEGQELLEIDGKVGLMHHYRSYDYAKKEKQTNDPVLSRYLDQVMINLKTKVSKFVEVNGQIN